MIDSKISNKRISKADQATLASVASQGFFLEWGSTAGGPLTRNFCSSIVEKGERSTLVLPAGLYRARVTWLRALQSPGIMTPSFASTTTTSRRIRLGNNAFLSSNRVDGRIQMNAKTIESATDILANAAFSCRFRHRWRCAVRVVPVRSGPHGASRRVSAGRSHGHSAQH